MADVIPIELLQVAKLEQRKCKLLNLDDGMYRVIIRVLSKHPRREQILDHIANTGNFIVMRKLLLSYEAREKSYQ